MKNNYEKYTKIVKPYFWSLFLSMSIIILLAIFIVKKYMIFKNTTWNVNNTIYLVFLVTFLVLFTYALICMILIFVYITKLEKLNKLEKEKQEEQIKKVKNYLIKFGKALTIFTMNKNIVYNIEDCNSIKFDAE
ncbi:hypothetical protein ACJA25_01970 [Mycoplasmopsis hyopharyngis]|uniref:hypothetical protein n=1 Tax=Mycoplasmopsis hyopharyngis TaxID=29558 RepID=UPI00387313CE